MQTKRIFALLLSLVMLLSCLPMTGSADTEPVVYVDSVNGSDSNTGLTEAQAVATMTAAYTALKNNIGTATRGKVVLVNDYTMVYTSTTGVKRDIASVDHSFEVVITGKTPQTALQFTLHTQCYLGMKGPTTLENITVRLTDDTASNFLSIHGKGKFTVGQGVSTSTNPDRRPSLSAAPYYASGIEKNMTVQSGDWRNVYAGGYINTMTGAGVLNFNGGTAVKIGTNFNGTQNGNMTINMNGGSVDQILGASVNSAGKMTGDVTINITGGTVNELIDPDGLGTLTGTTTLNIDADELTLKCPSTVAVNNFSCGKLTLGSATELNITGTVTGTTAVTVDPAIRYNFAYITAPTATADSAFAFSQTNMTVQTGTEKSWINLDAASGFTGLVLKVPSAQTVKLYPGTSGGSVITPDSTETVSGYKYQYYANIMGTYRYITSQSGYYTTTKVVYMSEAESLTRTEVDATAAKKAGTGFEPSNVKDYSDEMHKNIPSDETAPWWEDYSAYLNTPVFQEGRAAHQATTHAEMEDYIASLDGVSDNMYVYSMGTSETNGYNMPIVIFTTTDLSGAKTLEDAAALVRANNKVTVHYQAQIHGNEPAAGEAALAQIGRLDTAYGDNLLKTINIYVIPRLNPDGSYKYQRNSLTGINMNRDMLLAQTQEIKNHHYVYGLFEPELAIDSHEYTYQPENATGTYNDMMIASGHNGNSGDAFVQYSEMFARLPFDTLYSYNMQPSYYLNTTNGKYAASGTNYRGMRGSVSILLESRGIGGGNHTMERRVAAHLIAMEQILGYAAENSTELQAASDAERNRIANSGKTYEATDVLVLKNDTVPDSTLKHTNKTYNNATGAITSSYTTTPNAHRGTLDGRERARPTAYVIPAGESWTQNVLDLMDLQKISYYFVEAGATVQLQQYTGTVDAAALTAEQSYSFPNGCYVLPMNQQNATILALLMEPDVDDEHNVDAGGSTETVASGTLAQMEIIPSENEVFPIYRYVRNLNTDGTIDVIELPDAPEGLTVQKITVAGGTGSITGLDATKTYEYRAAADSTYTAVPAGATTISGLTVGTYYIRIAASGTTPASADTAVTVGYDVLDSYTVYINSSTGSDANNGYTESAPVKTIEQAYKQLDAIMADAPTGTSAKIILLADYALGTTRYAFPSHEYPVIFTAKTPAIALTKGGTTTQTTCSIDLSGPMTFEHMTLKNVSSSSYNNFNACGHTVVMGEGLTCVANSKGKYFMLGAGSFSSTASASTDLTVLSGTWEQLYVGGYTGPVTGDANLTVNNATIIVGIQASYNGSIGGNVNINLSNTTAPVLYGGNASKNDIGGNVTITLGENVSIPTIYAGSRDNGNVGGTVTLIIDGANVPSTANIYGKCKTNGTIGGFEVVLKNGTLAKAPTDITKVTVDTAAGGTVTYPASMGADEVKGSGVGQVENTIYAPLQYAANASADSTVTLIADCTADVKLVNDLYLDMAGYDLGGSIDLNSYKLYGYDTTTDDYTDTEVGHLTATVTGGTPERQFKATAERLGAIKRYLAVADENGYTFHRYFMGITHASIKPSTEGVGYKAMFMGSDTVKAQVKGLGYTLQIGTFDPVSVSTTSFISGKAVTLRVDHYDVENYGEAALNAKVFLNFGDVIVESSSVSYSLKDMVEAINTNFDSFDTTDQEAMKTLVKKYYEIMKDWNISSIYTPGVTVPDFENENEL